MAEGGTDDPRGAQEHDFSEDDLKYASLSSSSEFGPLKSNEPARNISVDEGYPTSPNTDRLPEGLEHLKINRSPSQETLKKLEGFLGVMVGMVQMSEGNRVELDNCRAIYERLNHQVSARSTDIEQLYDQVKGLRARIEQQQQQLESVAKTSSRQEDDKLKDAQQRDREEEIERKVIERMERALEEKMEKLEESVTAKIEKKMVRQIIEREQVQPGACSSEVLDNRAEEFHGAMQKALKERDKAKERFRVTEVRLLAEQAHNTTLVNRVRELEARCQKLEAENRQLKLRDMVHITHFTTQGTMLECFSCRCEYSTGANPLDACPFHPLPSMPYESWRNYISADDLPENFLQSSAQRSFYYWACCNILASRRPEGCRRGRHHQQWEMDIVMRQVLAEVNGDNLTPPLIVLR